MTANARDLPRILALAWLMASAAAGCAGPSSSPSPPPSDATSAMSAWSDEFDGPAGAFPDPRTWTYDLGNNGGWGNGELQEYTANRENVHLDGQGHLVIRVISRADGYTSARLKTQGLRAVHYGRVEARIKLPIGQGLWPAFWMLGSTFTGANWPECGEIDVMENVGSAPSTVIAAVHGPQYSGARGIVARHTLPGPGAFADDFHEFAVVWEPGSIRFLVDGGEHHRVTPQSLPAGAHWVFDQPFFLLLNVAVGGQLPGPPDASTVLPQEMVVDYVRYTP